MRPGVRWFRGLLAAAILCLPGSVRAADPKVPEEARAHFKIGVEYLNDLGGPRYEEALREFSTAHAIAPSPWKTPNFWLGPANAPSESNSSYGFRCVLTH